MHVQGSCFANQNLLLFRPFRSSRCRRCSLVGTLRSEDGDGGENVAEKVNSRYFKLYGAYSTSFNSSNVGIFFLELNSKRLYRSSGNEKESRCLVLTSSTTREIRNFHIVVMQ